MSQPVEWHARFSTERPIEETRIATSTAVPARWPENRAELLASASAWVACLTLIVAIALPGPYLPLISLGCALLFAVGSPLRQWHPIEAAALGLAAAWLLSALLTPLRAQVAPTLICAALVCGIARIRNQRAALALLAGVLVISTIVLTELSLLSVNASGPERRMAYDALSEWGGYPELGLLGSIVVPVLLGIALHARPRRVAIAAALAGVMAALGLILSLARGSWFTTALAAAVLLAISRSRRAVAALVAGLVLAGCAWAYVPLVRMYTSLLFTRTGNVTVSQRWGAWQLAGEVWRPRWLVGWGPGTYQTAFQARFPDSEQDARYHAHNELIHIGVETGAVGVAAAVCFAGVVLVSAARRLRSPHPMLRGIRIGLLASLIGVAVRMQLDYFDPSSGPERVMIVLSIVAGLAMAFGRTGDEPTG